LPLRGTGCWVPGRSGQQHQCPSQHAHLRFERECNHCHPSPQIFVFYRPILFTDRCVGTFDGVLPSARLASDAAAGGGGRPGRRAVPGTHPVAQKALDPRDLSGVVVANAYALVVAAVLVVGSLHRRWEHRRPADNVVRGPGGHGRGASHSGSTMWTALVNRAGILLLASGSVAAVVVGRTTALLLAARSHGPAPPLLGQVTAAVIGVAVAGILVLAARLLRSGVTRAVRYPVRARWATRLLLCGVVAAVIAATGSSVPVAGATSSPLVHPGAAWAAVQTRPQVRSGGAGSEVTWSSLGAKGREFLAGGPTAAAITAVTGRPAEESIRVYVGMHAAPPRRHVARSRCASSGVPARSTGRSSCLRCRPVWAG